MSKTPENASAQSLSFFEQFTTGRTEKNIIPQMSPEFPIGFDEKYLEARREGYIPVIISNHQSHADGLPMIPITRHLMDLEGENGIEDKTGGFMVIIADSMNTGVQEGQVTSAFKKLEGMLGKHKIEFLPYVREKDEKEYKMTRNQQKFIFSLKRGIKENKGIILMPEATVEGGRKKSGLLKRKIKGMQRFDREGGSDLYDFDRAIETGMRKALYICVGLNGGYNIFSADNNRITKRAQLAAINPIPTRFVSIRLALPVRSDEMKLEIETSGGQVNKASMSDYLGITVASLLPPEAQGQYREML